MGFHGMSSVSRLVVHELTQDRWADLETLFGPKGACAGCWCMWWRLTSSEFTRLRGTGTKRFLKKLVTAGETRGLIGYVDGKPVAWCALAPRVQYPRLDRSRILARVDDQEVWSITCFFVSRRHRRGGLTLQMLEASLDFARRRGAAFVEGYPVEPKKGKTADVFAFTGLASSFRKAGFKEVRRRSETRPIMRLTLRSGSRRVTP